MKTGLEHMEKRANLLQNGEKIPVIEREQTVLDIRIYGFSPTELYSYTIREKPTDIQIDQNGTLHTERRVTLVKSFGSKQWVLSENV